ncbi:hypothetical protein SUGI_0123790 [Cryptomeria japonica]|nr:hypothetical protein SUGI_0123790 [Cryptomeria japonica]
MPKEHLKVSEYQRLCLREHLMLCKVTQKLESTEDAVMAKGHLQLYGYEKCFCNTDSLVFSPTHYFRSRGPRQI